MGFWLIPVWKDTITSTDFYARFGDRISLPTWTDPRIPSHLIPLHQINKPVVWNPIRLNLFWKVVCIICEKRRLGHVTATAVFDSKDTSESNPDGVKSEDVDVYGDHLKIWCDLETALIVRRVISDVTIKAAIEATRSTGFSCPFFNPILPREEIELQAGPYDQKWLKHCVFMWFNIDLTPHGYA